MLVLPMFFQNSKGHTTQSLSCGLRENKNVLQNAFGNVKDGLWVSEQLYLLSGGWVSGQSDVVTCSLFEPTYQLPPFFVFVSIPALRSLNLEAELYKL